MHASRVYFRSNGKAKPLAWQDQTMLKSNLKANYHNADLLVPNVSQNILKNTPTPVFVWH